MAALLAKGLCGVVVVLATSISGAEYRRVNATRRDDDLLWDSVLPLCLWICLEYWEGSAISGGGPGIECGSLEWGKDLQRMLVRLERVLRHWLVLVSTTTRP